MDIGYTLFLFGDVSVAKLVLGKSSPYSNQLGYTPKKNKHVMGNVMINIWI